MGVVKRRRPAPATVGRRRPKAPPKVGTRQALGRELAAARRAEDWATVAIVREALARLTEEEESAALAQLVREEQAAAQVVARATARLRSVERGLTRGTNRVADVRAAQATLAVAAAAFTDVQLRRSLGAQGIAGRRQRAREWERSQRWNDKWGHIQEEA